MGNDEISEYRFGAILDRQGNVKYYDLQLTEDFDMYNRSKLGLTNGLVHNPEYYMGVDGHDEKKFHFES